jgi:hypothetical protein
VAHRGNLSASAYPDESDRVTRRYFESNSIAMLMSVLLVISATAISQYPTLFAENSPTLAPAFWLIDRCNPSDSPPVPTKVPSVESAGIAIFCAVARRL